MIVHESTSNKFIKNELSKLLKVFIKYSKRPKSFKSKSRIKMKIFNFEKFD